MNDNVYAVPLAIIGDDRQTRKILRRWIFRRLGHDEPILGASADAEGVHVLINGSVLTFPWVPPEPGL